MERISLHSFPVTHTHTHAGLRPNIQRRTSRLRQGTFTPPPSLVFPFPAYTHPPSIPPFFPYQVLNMLQLWNTASTIMDSDLSWGVGARIAQARREGGEGRKRAYLRPPNSVTSFPQAMATGRSSRLPLFRSLPPSLQAMGISGFMLEDPDSLLLDIPEHARRLRAQQEATYAVSDAQRLKETEVFRMADDGVRGVSPPSLSRSLPPWDPPPILTFVFLL